MIVKHLATHFLYYSECFSYPFYATQIISPLLNSLISANQEKWRNFSQSWNLYTPYCSSSVGSLLVIYSMDHWTCCIQRIFKTICDLKVLFYIYCFNGSIMIIFLIEFRIALAWFHESMLYIIKSIILLLCLLETIAMIFPLKANFAVARVGRTINI